jgi:hypothetical protein
VDRSRDKAMLQDVIRQKFECARPAHVGSRRLDMAGEHHDAFA